MKIKLLDIEAEVPESENFVWKGMILYFYIGGSRFHLNGQFAIVDGILAVAADVACRYWLVKAKELLSHLESNDDANRVNDFEYISEAWAEIARRARAQEKA